MNNKIKNILVAAVVAVMAFGAFARPAPGPRPGGPGPGPRPAHHRPAPPPPRHHHHNWGHGGSHFWPGFAGAVVGGILYDTVVAPRVQTPVVVQTTPVVVQQQPVVVQTPVTTVQNVWVEGRYVDQVQANGTVIRVWQPGHYEQRTVLQ